MVEHWTGVQISFRSEFLKTLLWLLQYLITWWYTVLFIHYFGLVDLEWREEAQLYLVIMLPWLLCHTMLRFGCNVEPVEYRRSWRLRSLKTPIPWLFNTLSNMYSYFYELRQAWFSFFFLFFSALAGIIFYKPFLLVLEMLLPKIRCPILMLLKTIPWISCFRGWEFWCYVWSCVWRAISWWTATKVMLCVELE